MPDRSPSCGGEVAFEDVSFSYFPDQPLIEELSLAVAPGETVAIVGPTGCRQDDSGQSPDALLRGRQGTHHP